MWDTSYPTSLKHKADMRKFTWKYTQFSQFNSSDTLLLVSGVHFGSLSTSGEIAVFSLEGEYLKLYLRHRSALPASKWLSNYSLFGGYL